MKTRFEIFNIAAGITSTTKEADQFIESDDAIEMTINSFGDVEIRNTKLELVGLFKNGYLITRTLKQ